MRVIYHNWSATKQRPHPQILNGFTSQLVIEFRISERLTGNSFYVKVSPSLQWRRSCGGLGVLTLPLSVSVGIQMDTDPSTFYRHAATSPVMHSRPISADCSSSLPHTPGYLGGPGREGKKRTGRTK